MPKIGETKNKYTWFQEGWVKNGKENYHPTSFSA